MPAIRGHNSSKKTRRHTRDIDQIHADLHNPRHLELHKQNYAVEDLPGLGQNYCIECAKWFESADNFEKHCRGKPHKRRVRQLKDEPYTQREAEIAAGLATDNGKRTKETAAPEVEMEGSATANGNVKEAAMDALL